MWRRCQALNYQKVASLEEYVLAAQANREVTVFRRSENWDPVTVRSGDGIIELRSIGCSVPLRRIYERAFR